MPPVSTTLRHSPSPLAIPLASHPRAGVSRPEILSAFARLDGVNEYLVGPAWAAALQTAGNGIAPFSWGCTVRFTSQTGTRTFLGFLTSNPVASLYKSSIRELFGRAHFSGSSSFRIRRSGSLLSDNTIYTLQMTWDPAHYQGYPVIFRDGVDANFATAMQTFVALYGIQFAVGFGGGLYTAMHTRDIWWTPGRVPYNKRVIPNANPTSDQRWAAADYLHDFSGGTAGYVPVQETDNILHQGALVNVLGTGDLGPRFTDANDLIPEAVVYAL